MIDGHQLVSTRVMHERCVGPRYRFSYRMFALLLDLDHLPALAHRSRLFRFNRPGVVSFHESDHGPRDGTRLRPWLESHLAARGIELDGGPVSLLCLPRIFGYGFNPLTVWYCRHRDGSLRAVLCEVHNTFGEQHCYLLHDAGAPMDWPVTDRHAKRFHVSPFFDVTGEYRFRISEPSSHLSVGVSLERDGETQLRAAQGGQVRALTDARLLRALVGVPFASLKVIVTIHWRALRIWLGGATFHPKPNPPTQEVS